MAAMRTMMGATVTASEEGELLGELLGDPERVTGDPEIETGDPEIETGEMGDPETETGEMGVPETVTGVKVMETAETTATRAKRATSLAIILEVGGRG